MICWFWLEAKFINVVSMGGGCKDVKSIGGLELDTDDDIGSMAWGWPATIIERGCIVWEGANPAAADAMVAVLLLATLEFIIWAAEPLVAPGKLSKYECCNPRVL